MKHLARWILALSVALPVAGIAQTSAETAAPITTPAAAPTTTPATAQTQGALGWRGKLKFHATKTVSPTALIGFAAYAAVLQEMHSPEEWKQGGAAYGKRVASMVAWSGVHSALAFGLDTALHQDPRYYRLGSTGILRRVGHAVRGTILTRTDSGGETLSTWRLGSAYGSAFISNMWYPDRLNNPRLGVIQGSIQLACDLAGNLGLEFWPDIKGKIFHRKVTQ